MHGGGREASHRKRCRWRAEKARLSHLWRQAKARLSEAKARLSRAKARLSWAKARLSEAEARLSRVTVGVSIWWVEALRGSRVCRAGVPSSMCLQRQY